MPTLQRLPRPAAPTLQPTPQPWYRGGFGGWPWPLPALAAWSLGWGLWLGLPAAGLPMALCFSASCLAATALAWRCQGPWRQGIAAAGFPLSAAALGAAAGVPPWLWLLLLLPVLLAYPLRAWRDAPFFPTPAAALQGLGAVVSAPASALDAGCGLGHGLAALRSVWPQARLHGIEWSPLLALAARLRCRCLGLQAQVQRGDMWAASWAGHGVVYVFQRPESMARVWSKAQADMAPGACLVSLEFAVPGQQPVACLAGPGRRPVWVYRPRPAAPPAVPATTHSTAARRGR